MPGVVDQDVDLAEGVDRGVDDPFGGARSRSRTRGTAPPVRPSPRSPRRRSWPGPRPCRRRAGRPRGRSRRPRRPGAASSRANSRPMPTARSGDDGHPVLQQHRGFSYVVCPTGGSVVDGLRRVLPPGPEYYRHRLSSSSRSSESRYAVASAPGVDPFAETEDQSALRSLAREVGRREVAPRARQGDVTGELPARGDQGHRRRRPLPGHHRRAVGRPRLGDVEASIVLEEIARHDVSTAICCQLAFNGPSRGIEHLGSRRA